MKNFISALILLLYFSLPVFGQMILCPPPGLKFNEKYLTEKQLEEFQTPEITMPHFEEFQHGFPQAGISSYYVLKKDFIFYKNKFFQIENDSTGRQWIHLSMDAREYAVSHAHLKNLLKNQNAFKFNEDSNFEFSFNINTSEPNEQLQFFVIYFDKPLKISLFRILYRQGKILADIPEFKDKKVKERNKVFIGLYELGTEAKIKFTTGNGCYSIFYNDKEMFRQELTENFETSAKAYYQVGPYPDDDKKYFCEMFVTDLNTAP